jgi:hypothetical protein
LLSDKVTVIGPAAMVETLLSRELLVFKDGAWAARRASAAAASRLQTHFLPLNP